MGIEFTTTDRSQVKAVADLLQRSFRSAPDAPFLHLPLLVWKYYEPGPAWPGSRSYVLTDGTQILAHAAIWPLQIQLKGTVHSGIGFSDWAASEEHRGVGLLLVKRLLQLAPFTLVIGGAEITRQILPRMGFRHWADLPVYARVLRPFRQFRTRPSYLGWREPARSGRNLLWWMKPIKNARTWTAVQCQPQQEMLEVVKGQDSSIHSLDFLRFMLRCPTASIRFFSLLEAEKLRGYAVVSVVNGQARITSLRLASEEPGDWGHAVAAVIHEVRRDETACELVALGSTALLENALKDNGFVLRDSRPLVVFDSEGRLSTETVPQLGLLEDDASFLSVPQYPYLT